MKIKFKEGNNILYGQDFSTRRGIPANIEFEVEKFGNDAVKLTGRGYGLLQPVRQDNGSYNYGNGSLFVYVEHMPKSLVAKLVKHGIITEKNKALEKLVDYSHEWAGLLNCSWDDNTKSKVRKQMIDFVDNYL